GAVEAVVDDGVERRVQRLDPRDGGVDELRGRGVAARDELRQCGCVEPREVVGHRARRLAQPAFPCGRGRPGLAGETRLTDCDPWMTSPFARAARWRPRSSP